MCESDTATSKPRLVKLSQINLGKHCVTKVGEMYNPRVAISNADPHTLDFGDVDSFVNALANALSNKGSQLYGHPTCTRAEHQFNIILESPNLREKRIKPYRAYVLIPMLHASQAITVSQQHSGVTLGTCEHIVLNEAPIIAFQKINTEGQQISTMAALYQGMILLLSPPIAGFNQNTSEISFAVLTTPSQQTMHQEHVYCFLLRIIPELNDEAEKVLQILTKLHMQNE
ncbi:MAG: hypothetical protein ACOCXP_01950 [Candidatus Dojkabacteria bacterium]